jgi:DNA ligase-1
MGNPIKPAFVAPMLAKILTDDNVCFPCFVQPKLNGIRCLWDGVTARTRSGLPHAAHIQQMAAQWPVTAGVADGELVLEPGTPLEVVQSAVAAPNDDSPRLQFGQFDVQLATAWRDRYDAIRSVCIETTLIRTDSQLESAMERFLASGYEGLIARRPDGLYVSGNSANLLKYKPFQDAEFPVIDVVEAQGKDAGTALLVCATADGQPFGVRPSGSRPVRRKMLAERTAWIGRPYTVRFQGFTSYGLPRSPVGVAERTDIRWVMSFQV